jgi:hypothetical protein
MNGNRKITAAIMNGSKLCDWRGEM